LQGRYLFDRRSSGDLLQAKSHFEKAVQADPNYARAWAALAGVYFVARYESVELPNAIQNWGDAAERAVTLAPDLAEAHLRAAQYYMHGKDSSQAQTHFARAQALDPNDPLVLGMSMTHAVSAGRMEEAVEIQKRVVAIDPLSATNRGNLGGLLMMTGHLPEAQAELERALELSPTLPSTRANIADVLILQGRPDEALKAIARLPEGYARDQRFTLAYFARGDESEGDAMLARLIALAEKPDTDATVAVAIAEVYASRNDAERAFKWLETARLRSQTYPGVLPGWAMHENLEISPYLKPLHADPRWEALLAATADQ
jgi:Tfp pilus assembly protein PilF